MSDEGPDFGAGAYLTVGVIAGIPLGFGIVLPAAFVLGIAGVNIDDGLALGLTTIALGIGAVLWKFRGDAQFDRKDRLLLIGGLLGLAVDVSLWVLLWSSCTARNFN